MDDPILRRFLETQFVDGMRLAGESELLKLAPVHGVPPDAYLAEFSCRGLVREDDGSVNEADTFVVAIRFCADHLRRLNPLQTVAFLHPSNVWHPNINGPAQTICLGHMAPGVGLVDILYQVFDIVSYRKVTMREDDCLNWAACSWARANQDRFPIDARPLKARRRGFDVAVEGLG